jgi:hypothetical protein
MPEPLEVRVLRLEQWVADFEKQWLSLLPNVLTMAKQIESLADEQINIRDTVKFFIRGKGGKDKDS